MNLTLNYKNKKISFDAERVSSLGKIIGLMFCRREKASILLFDFEKLSNISIHSFFVFFPFIAIWLDDKNRIIDLKKVEPFRVSVSPKNKFAKLIEIPINKKHKKIISDFNF